MLVKGATGGLVRDAKYETDHADSIVFFTKKWLLGSRDIHIEKPDFLELHTKQS